jgi:hypothetical protein
MKRETEANMVDVKREGDKLIITLDVSATAIAAARPSTTGKSRIVQGTGGYIPIEGGMKLSLNLITK